MTNRIDVSAVLFAICIGTSTSGCGVAVAPSDSGIDAFVDAVDAADETDAFVGSDAALLDSGPPDGDDDGVTTARDCDDSDPMVGTTGTRECTTVCGTGTDRCADGVWVGCSAGLDCVCTGEGTLRTVPCGRCGMQTERCVDGLWTESEMCHDETGVCVPDAEERRMGDYCQNQMRSCGFDCMWDPWVDLTPRGQCERGASVCTDELDCICNRECMCEGDNPACRR